MFRSRLWPRAGTFRPQCPPTVARSGSRGLATRGPSSRLRSPNDDGGPRRTTARSLAPPPLFNGRQQLRKLQEDGIGMPRDLKRVRLSTPIRNFGINIGPRHCLRQMDLDWFGEIAHPKGLLIAERCYDLARTKPLWASTLVMGATPVVRGKAKARVNMALRQALANMGYDAEGRKVDVTKPHYPARVGDGSDAWRKKIVKVQGSLHMHAHDALDILNRPFDQLRRAFEQVVRSMEEEMGRTADGQKANMMSSGKPRQHYESAKDKPRGNNNNWKKSR